MSKNAVNSKIKAILVMICVFAVISVGAVMLFTGLEAQGGASDETHSIDGLESLIQFLHDMEDNNMNEEAVNELVALFTMEGQAREAYFDDFDYMINAFSLADYAQEAREWMDTFSNINDLIFLLFLIQEDYEGFLQDTEVVVTPVTIEYVEAEFGDIYSFMHGLTFVDMSYIVLPNTGVVLLYPAYCCS